MGHEYQLLIATQKNYSKNYLIKYKHLPFHTISRSEIWEQFGWVESSPGAQELQSEPWNLDQLTRATVTRRFQ